MAYDLIARVAALAAINAIRGSSIDLFVNLGSHMFESSVTAVTTGGYSSAGTGAATYVADNLATAALAAAHPRLCKQSQDGRYWRLVPTNGAITVDQAGALGDPTGKGLVNDQVPIQAAVNYAVAMGIRAVVFPQYLYAIWMPTRTTAFWTYATDGHGIYIPASLTGVFTLRGTGPRTTINYFGNTGLSLANSLQTIAVDGNPWRGSAIFQDIPATDPGLVLRPTLVVENLDLQGGTTANGNAAWSNPPTDLLNGWDVSNKGIFVRPDRYNGDLILDNTRIVGFRGELVFTGNLNTSSLLLRGRCEFGETNGQAINPACGNIICEAPFLAWNCNFAFEGWGGHGVIWGELYNLLQSGSMLTGGVIDTTGSGNGFKPQRTVDTRFAGTLGLLEVNLLITSAQKTIYFGSFMRGRIIAVDTVVSVGANETAGPFKLGVIDTDLDITVICDKGNLSTALGLSGGTAAGSKQIRDCRYRLSLKRSRDAIDAGYQITDAVVYSGSIGENVVVESSSGPSRRGNAITGTVAALPDYYPVFRNNSFDRWSDYSTVTQTVTTTPVIIPRGDFMALSGGGATNSVTSITLPTTGIGDGHELTLYNSQGPSGNWYFAIERSGAGARLPARRLVGGADRIKLKFDAVTALWNEVIPPKPPSLFTTVTLPAVAASGISAVQTVTLYGAETGMTAKITPTSPNTALEIVNPQVTAANTVSFRVREVSGSAYAGGGYNLSIVTEHQRTWLS